MSAWLRTVLVVLSCAAGAAWADAKKADKPPAGLPDLTESAKLAAKMPKSVSGLVYVDRNANGRCDEGEAMESVRLTDGVDFVQTDSEGKYTIAIQPAPLIPYLPSRTVSVCWPDGTWPPQNGGAGRWRWWVRLKDVKDPGKVDFRLLPRQEKPPICVAFGTDPHDALRRPQNYVFRDEVARGGRHVAFGVMGGDLGYLGFGNADRDYAAIEQYTNNFPVRLFHCVGNHDVVGVHGKWWAVPHELAGNGAFLKYLGPIRWSFDLGGVHFVGMDWLLIDAKGHTQCGMANSAIDWLEKDLKSVPKGRPVYFFNHQPWSPNERFYEICSKYGVKLCLGGHSHRNMFLAARGGVEYWTKMSLYTLVYIDKGGFEFVDRCIYRGGRNGWDGHWHHGHRGCALYIDAGLQNKQRGEHVGLENVTVTRGPKPVPTVDGATYDIRFGARGVGRKPARRFGLRITTAAGTHELAYDEVTDMLSLVGRRTFFNPVIPLPHTVRGSGTTDPKEQTWIEMRIHVMPDRLRVRVNSRLHYQKFVKLGPARRIELFAEDGSAEFGRVDVWQRTWPKTWKPRRTANTG